MAFTPKALLETDVEFKDSDKVVKPLVVEGRGQMVYWKGCSVFTSRENGEKKNHYEEEGKAVVEKGVDVYFTEGQVTER